jgi:shikimate dehydrogenase
VKRVYGIVGWPVWHTRSPGMHNAAFEALGIDAVYVPFGVPPSKLYDAVRGLSALGIKGFNVTLPHKQTIVPMLDDVDDETRAIGAVNTVVHERGRLIGSNTDAEGLVRALKEAGHDPAGADVVVVGAGGAARAAVAGLARAEAARIVVVARRLGAAEQLVADLGRLSKKTSLVAAALGVKSTREAFDGATLFVQATSATLDDGPESDKFASSLPLNQLDPGAVVTDVVYAPRETAVLRRAKKHGLVTVDGLGMLLHQGAIALERWTKKVPPLEAMRDAL